MLFNLVNTEQLKALNTKIAEVGNRIVTQATGISVSDTVATMLGLSGTNKNVEYAFRNIANIIPKDFPVYTTLYNGNFNIANGNTSSFQLSDITSNYNELIIISENTNITANAGNVYISFNSSASADSYDIEVVLGNINVSRVVVYKTGYNNSVIQRSNGSSTVTESKAFNNRKGLYMFNLSSRTATGNIKVIGVKYKIN